MKKYVTRVGASLLLKKKSALIEELRTIQGQKGEAAEVGGNQWHDNFAFEDLSRQEWQVNNQIKTVGQAISEMVVVDMPTRCEYLEIGHMATVTVDGLEKVFQVGGHGEGNSQGSPQVISYDAPLVQPIIGQEEGFATEVELGGRKKLLVLQRINLPQTGEVS